MKQKIREFVMNEIKLRVKKVEKITDQTPLITSGLLDSLFVVDLILFLEELVPKNKIDMTTMKKENLDNLEKIYAVVGI